jgi:hypothetical protein
MIELNAQCHSFGMRLCWMLSSLADQRGAAGLFKVSVAYAADEPGALAACRVLDYFKGRLSLVRREYPDMAAMMLRGRTRSAAAMDTDAEWIFFADCDAVYHPDYMAALASELGRLRGEAAGKCVWSARRTMAVEAGEALVGSMARPAYVPDSFKRADAVSTAWSKPCPCVGNTQIALAADVRARGGYSPGKADASWLAGAGNTKSDVGFRRSMDGCLRLELPDQIHINHKRDAGSGRHLTEQR